MRLKFQIILLFILTTVLLILSISLIANSLLFNQISNFEENNARQTMTSLNQNVIDTIQSEQTTAIEWSNWDDSYDFVVTRNPGFINSVLVDETFRTGNLNIVMFINNSGTPVFSKGYDPMNNTGMQIPAEFLGTLESHGILGTSPNPIFQGRAGVLIFPDSVMLVSVEPILTSTGAGPSHGVLVRARYLDPDTIAGKFGLPPGSFRVLPGEPAIPSVQESHADNVPLFTAVPVSIQVGLDTLQVTNSMEDFYGQPMHLELTLERTFYTQGIETLSLIVLAISVLGVLSGIMLIAFFHTTVIQPLDLLGREAREIGESKNFSRRVMLPAQDEFRYLGSSINQMLDSLETTARERVSAEQKYRDLFESSHEGIILMDPEGHILDANKSFLTMHNSLKLTDLTGVSFYSLFDAKCASHLEELAKGRIQNGISPEYLECELTANDTEPLPVSLTCWPMSDFDGTIEGTWWLMKDIGEKKEIERLKLKAFVQIDKNIEQISILNDELRNPLAVIVGLADLYDNPVREQIIAEAEKINEIIAKLDRGWLESQKVKEFLKKYYVNDTT